MKFLTVSRITRDHPTLGENLGYSYSERVAIGEAIETELGGRHGGDRTETKPENLPACPSGDTRDIAAKAAGFGNGNVVTTERSARAREHEVITQSGVCHCEQAAVKS